MKLGMDMVVCAVVATVAICTGIALLNIAANEWVDKDSERKRRNNLNNQRSK